MLVDVVLVVDVVVLVVDVVLDNVVVVVESLPRVIFLPALCNVVAPNTLKENHLQTNLAGTNIAMLVQVLGVWVLVLETSMEMVIWI